MLNRLKSLYTQTVQTTVILVLFLSASAQASEKNYEIYVFYNKFCHHCKSWMNTTGATYDSDASKFLGQNVPKLTKYDLSERNNMSFYRELLSSGKLSSPIEGVPAFIIVDNNQIEVSRSIGAMESKDFYQFVSTTTKPDL